MSGLNGVYTDYVKNTDDVYRIHSLLMPSKKSSFEKAQEVHDYITSPKDDGYRSLHQVFKYKGKGKNTKYDGFRLEIQIRTLLQHYWATAVETLGMVDKVSYKTGNGELLVKDYFRYASRLFAITEKANTDSLEKDKILSSRRLMKLEDELKISFRLQGIAISSKHIQQTSSIKEDTRYFVLELSFENKGKSKIKIMPFDRSSLEQAESLYRSREKDTQDNKNIAVLLISAKNINDIKKAYPNYFLNTQKFLQALKQAIII